MRTFDWINNDRHERGIRHVENEFDSTRYPWVRPTALARETPSIVRQIDDVKPPPGFGPTPEALSGTALERWEQEQHDVFTRRQARLNRLESVEQDRKDSAQYKTWVTTSWLGRPAKGSSVRTSTTASQHDNEPSTSVDSPSEPGSDCLPIDKGKGPADEEAFADVETSGLPANVPIQGSSNRVRVIKVTRPPRLRHHASALEYANELRENRRKRNEELREKRDPPPWGWGFPALDVELLKKFPFGHPPRRYNSDGDLIEPLK